ncbi:hypothetical protein MLD38_009062 [Melastoma candidum]|uniref:Uncharacterized protein n=1 Tax=Melastoma candidum TaxID=119954 RepID=A0ACB9RWW6_9MYRT|nr:hypothetical protein MLD38_009062 [Melastoma candidum]
MNNDTGGTPRHTCGPDEKVGSKSSPADEELNNVSRYVEPTGKPGPVVRLLGQSSVRASSMEEKGGRFRRQTCDPHVPAPSSCSQGASNNPGVPLKRTYEDCQSSSQSGTDSEDSERTERSSRAKARRASVYHSSSERRRSGRVDKKLKVLQELLPNCNQKKADQVAVLDEAIDYLQTLQRQLHFQVLSTGSPMYMSPSMMLSTGIQQMYAPYLNQFPAVNIPRGVNIGAGVGCGGIQFPISHYPRTPTPSLGSGILGLQSMAHIPPFIASFGQPSAPSLSTQAPSTDLLDSAGRPGSGDIA